MRGILRQLYLPLVLVVAVTALAGLSCKENNSTRLNLSITTQPHGGQGVNTVSCTYEGTSWSTIDNEEFPDPITVTTFWQTPHSRYNQESHTWTYHNQTQVITTSRSAPSGMYLDKPHWLVIQWSDKGGDYVIVSDTAECY
jgi:hypothetical protein